MTSSKKFYITTPLYYVNAEPHIGHSYTQIASDTVARFRRLLKDEVFFMTGTDEHGEKIEQASMAAGFKAGDEKRFVDSIVPNFKKLWSDLNIEYDFFIRTTDPFHEEAVRGVLKLLYESGEIYKGEYEGFFCVPCEMFWSNTQAPDGICPDCKRPLERIKERNYFLKLSEYQDWLITHIKDNPRFIMPEYRKNEVLSFLENNRLNDLCISRSKKRLRWGIELPFDKEYVAYVWVDALINYISGAGYLDDKERFKRLWPADLHIIGKDILRHHAVYWPIMLHAAGLEQPKTIFAHGWWTAKGEKMSKSRGNVVDPARIIKKYGVEPYRYFLLRDVPFGLDGTFSEEALVGRFNSDLANDLGNLLNRTLTMVEKYSSGVIEKAQGGAGGAAQPGKELAGKVKAAMEELIFSDALGAIWDFVNRANKSIEVTAPWKLSREGKTTELKGFVYGLMEILGITAVALSPFMPKTARAIWDQMGLEDFDRVKFADIENFTHIKPGTKIKKGAPLFPRIKL